MITYNKPFKKIYQKKQKLTKIKLFQIFGEMFNSKFKTWFHKSKRRGLAYNEIAKILRFATSKVAKKDFLDTI